MGAVLRAIAAGGQERSVAFWDRAIAGGFQAFTTDLIVDFCCRGSPQLRLNVKDRLLAECDHVAGPSLDSVISIGPHSSRDMRTKTPISATLLPS